MAAPRYQESSTMSTNTEPRPLGDGLQLRWTGPEDVERVAELVSYVFRNKAEDPPNAHLTAWTRDLGSGRHPLTGVDQGLFVEDTRTGKAVASMWLIPTAWSYEGITFGVGRPEQVACHPDYRQRGLIRALFETFHARSAAAGDLAQGITGIPYFYRQFGYEYAIDLGGERVVSFSEIPKLAEGAEEPFTLRDATVDDLAFVNDLYDRDRARGPVSTPVPAAFWRWTHDGVDVTSMQGWKISLVVDREGARRGCVVGWKGRWGSSAAVHTIAVAEGTSLQAALPSILRGIRDYAPTLVTGREPKEPDRILLALGARHPVYDLLGSRIAPYYEPPYAWYVRVPDQPALIRHLAPALERRLAASPAAGYSGELRIDMYRVGLRLLFKDGRLEEVGPWSMPVWDRQTSAGIPQLVFLQLLFGRRSLDELRAAHPDVWAGDEARPVLEAIFPARPSRVLDLN
jgi:GNAT superfamily N-acetyltransferase